MIMQYSNTRIFQIHETGPTTLVSFGPDGCPNHCYHPEYLEDLTELIVDSQCNTLAFDFANVNFLASGLVGLMACVRKRHGVEIEIRNPSPYIQTALEALQLTKLLTDDSAEDLVPEESTASVKTI